MWESETAPQLVLTHRRVRTCMVNVCVPVQWSTCAPIATLQDVGVLLFQTRTRRMLSLSLSLSLPLPHCMHACHVMMHRSLLLTRLRAERRQQVQHVADGVDQPQVRSREFVARRCGAGVALHQPVELSRPQCFNQSLLVVVEIVIARAEAARKIGS
jgi:hypothetical protein